MFIFETHGCHTVKLIQVFTSGSSFYCTEKIWCSFCYEIVSTNYCGFSLNLSVLDYI